MADMSGQMPIPTPKKLQVFKELKARGLPYQTISGLMGNIDVETGGTFDYKQKFQFLIKKYMIYTMPLVVEE